MSASTSGGTQVSAQSGRRNGVGVAALVVGVVSHENVMVIKELIASGKGREGSDDSCFYVECRMDSAVEMD
jgi:hypothetical protein